MSGAAQPGGVSEEPTLEAFAGDGSDREEGGGASPLPVTGAYRPGGECASCGASSARLWVESDGGGDSADGSSTSSRVCVGCADWTSSTGGRAADQ